MINGCYDNVQKVMNNNKDFLCGGNPLLHSLMYPAVLKYKADQVQRKVGQHYDMLNIIFFKYELSLTRVKILFATDLLFISRSTVADAQLSAKERYQLKEDQKRRMDPVTVQDELIIREYMELGHLTRS